MKHKILVVPDDQREEERLSEFLDGVNGLLKGEIVVSRTQAMLLEMELDDIADLLLAADFAEVYVLTDVEALDGPKLLNSRGEGG